MKFSNNILLAITYFCPYKIIIFDLDIFLILQSGTLVAISSSSTTSTLFAKAAFATKHLVLGLLSSTAVLALLPSTALAWCPSLDALLAFLAPTEVPCAQYLIAISTVVASPHFFIQINSFKLKFFSIFFLDIVDAWCSHGAVDHKGHHHQSHDKLHFELKKGFFSSSKTKYLLDMEV